MSQISSTRPSPSWPNHPAGQQRATQRLPCLRRQDGLSGRKTEGHVDHGACIRERSAGHQSFFGQRNFNRNIIGNGRKFPAFFNHGGGVCGGDFGAHRPLTTWHISAIASRNGRPDLAMSDGFVVTPSTMPVSVSAVISSRSAVSIKNFIAVTFYLQLWFISHRFGLKRNGAYTA